jgi:hypothetical protein
LDVWRDGSAHLCAKSNKLQGRLGLGIDKLGLGWGAMGCHKGLLQKVFFPLLVGVSKRVQAAAPPPIPTLPHRPLQRRPKPSVPAVDEVIPVREHLQRCDIAGASSVVR